MRLLLPVAALAVGAFTSSQASADGLLSAVLPFARAVQLPIPPAEPGSQAEASGPGTVTAFGTIYNDSPMTAVNCRVEKPAGFEGTFGFQETDPETNEAVGVVDGPVSIPPATAQTFVFAMNSDRLLPGEDESPTLFAPRFTCDNVGPAPQHVGVNGFNLVVTAGTTPDIITVAATPSGDGIVTLPGTEGTTFFSAAAINIGASNWVQISSGDGQVFGLPAVPVSSYICETTETGTIIECSTVEEAGKLDRFLDSGEILYFSVFIDGLGQPIAFDPADTRYFVRFNSDFGEGPLVGASSVAIQTAETEER